MGDLSIPLLGMSHAAAELNRTATRISCASLLTTDPASDQIDLSAEIVALIRARCDFQANVKSAHALNETDQELLRLLP